MASGAEGAGTGLLGWVLGIGAALAVVAGGLYMSGVFAPATIPTELGQSAPVASDTVEEKLVENPAGPDPEPETKPEAAADAPAIDVVRVDAGGEAVIAGTAEPGSSVQLLLDGKELTVVQADADGGFVSLLTLPISTAPRILTILAELDGKTVPSDDQIILAPSVAPEQVAEAAASNEQDKNIAQTAEPSDTGTSDTTQSEPAPEVAEAATAPSDTSEGATTGGDDPAKIEKTETSSGDPAQSQMVPEETADTDTEIAEGNPTATAANPSDATVSTATDVSPSQSTPTETAGDDPTTTSPQVAALTTAPESGSSAAANVSPESLETTPAKQSGGVTVLRAGSDGVELLQPGTPDQPPRTERIALDTISYSETGEVLLSGRAQDQSLIRIYLDNNPIADLSTDNAGRWKGQFEGIEPGVYTLRLDEVNAEGQVLSRLETPFKREAPEVLQPPASETLAETPLIRAVTVQAGDTLWAISRDRYGDGVLYVRVFEANRDNIRDPDLIYPGQVFSIPE